MSAPDPLTYRSYWNPYTDDAPEARIEVTGMNGLAILGLIGKSAQPSEMAEIARAMANHGPFNSVSLGCIFHTSE